MPDGEVDPTGDQPYLQTPVQQSIDGKTSIQETCFVGIIHWVLNFESLFALPAILPDYPIQ